LDDWIAEVGEDYIVDLVEVTRRGVADGTVPAFNDKDAFPAPDAHRPPQVSVTWRVLTTPASEPDFRVLTTQDRASVVEDLFAWVEHGLHARDLGWSEERCSSMIRCVRVHSRLLRERSGPLRSCRAPPEVEARLIESIGAYLPHDVPDRSKQ